MYHKIDIGKFRKLKSIKLSNILTETIKFFFYSLFNKKIIYLLNGNTR